MNDVINRNTINLWTILKTNILGGETMTKNWTHSYDVVVVGSGGGGLSAALTAEIFGMSSIVIEKTEVFGGSTAKSGGTIWVPNNTYLQKAGVPDSDEKAKTYMDATVGDRVPEELKNAYLTKGKEMIDFFDKHTKHVRWAYTPGYSDYYPELPGGMPEGRSIEAALFDLRKLGDDLDKMRRAGLPTKGMVLTSYEFHKVNMIMRTWIGKLTSLRVGMRLIRTMLTKYNPTTLGEALVARLYKALKDEGGDVWVSTPFKDLVTEDGKVTGVVAEQNGKTIYIQAKKGVVLAAGGFSLNQEMREKYLPSPTNYEWSLSSDEQEGDVIKACLKLGAKLDLMDKLWGTPTVLPPGQPAFMPVAERAVPGLIIVNQAGERYINESVPYHEFVDTMYEKNKEGAETVPSWIVLDSRAKKRYLIFGILPFQDFPEQWVESGFLKVGNTPEELAKEMGVDTDKFAATIKRFNRFAENGKDEDFQRGDSAYDQYYGDPKLDNPNLAPLDQGPFYAVQTFPGDIGTKGGLVTDGSARVLKEDGTPIEGLYATGNCQASSMGETYPGAGATIGAAMTFGYAAAKDMVD